MKALVLHNPQDLVFETQWPMPSNPSNWPLLKVHASGICGSDLPRIMKTGSYHHPIILGHEFSGTVADSGDSQLQIGEQAAVIPIIPCGQCSGCEIGPFHCTQYDFIGSRRDGGFAEYCAVPPTNLFSLPPNIQPDEGAFIEPLAVTLHALRRYSLSESSRTLVFGGGAIGILCAQWAKILGSSEVILADIRDEALYIAQACGVNHVVNPRSEEFKTLGEFDHIIEAAGATKALFDSITLARSRGTLTLIGREIKDILLPLDLFELILRKELDIKGSWGFDLHQDREFINKTLSEGKLILSPMITHQIDLSEGTKIIPEMWKKSFYFCKVMFRIL